jgi:hypothetical protein
VVIGKTFAWGHIPKTGGDATLALFRLFPEVIVFADDVTANAKHAYFPAREGQLAEKTLMLNIRKLPDWILSWAHQRHRGAPGFPPEKLATPAEMAEWDIADQMLAAHTDNGRLTIGRWLRMEFLKEDFLSFISECTDVSEANKAAIESAPKINLMRYDHDTDRWFSDAQMARLRERNPRWSALERRLYEDG